MSSEKSPFKAGGLTPRGMKSRETRKPYKYLTITCKEIKRTQIKGGGMKDMDFSRPRWKISFGKYYFMSKKIHLHEAVIEFRNKYPGKRVTRIVPAARNAKG